MHDALVACISAMIISHHILEGIAVLRKAVEVDCLAMIPKLIVYRPLDRYAVTIRNRYLSLYSAKQWP